MANTTNGLPFPVGTDKVVDGDNAIRALAEAVDANLLPFGHVRARCTTSSSHGGAAWNLCPLDVLADAKGAQPWVLEAVSRRVKVTKAGVYLIAASLTMNGTLALAIATSLDGTTWNRTASVPVGSVNYANATSTVVYLAVNTYVAMMMYSPTTQSTLADTPSTPSFLSLQALGGQ